MQHGQLQQLGKKVSQLSGMWHGENSNPFDHIESISSKTGISQELLLSALYTQGGESSGRKTH